MTENKPNINLDPNHQDTFLSTFNRKNKAWINHHFSQKKNLILAGFICGLVILFFLYYFFLHPPRDFAVKEFIELPKGATIDDAGKILNDNKIIKSEIAFKILYRLKWWTDDEGVVRAGSYFFAKPLPLWQVVYQVATGDYGVGHIKVTIPEGLTLRQMANVLERHLPNFDRGRFLLLTKNQEGYLFPDTYFFSPNNSEAQIIAEMKEIFDQKIQAFESDIKNSSYSFEEIIIMASILEKEAITADSKKIIAGILWKRMETGMKLQVDAVFPYIFGKNTFDLTRADLRFDSPYNTYLYEGLPPTPIASPGLDSIIGALYPEPNDYWFYLSDYDSEMHYARTYDEHLANRRKYLNK